MEGLQKVLQKIPREHKLGSSYSEKPSFSGGVSASSSEHSQVLATRVPRQVVSLWTCSKLCAIFFAAGVIVGYTLKRRVRHWASKLLKKLKDD
ncbi:uncharacterized protein LOC131157615 [Malania oleifera]|uniref:uncharacterized protein LOC131157615 n=1 Tax=Malania oleifera TaxID=397392 RepID=UPI0025AEB0FB|nr:uncharacterized protein LOC131157615 [Malania oleifera]